MVNKRLIMDFAQDLGQFNENIRIRNYYCRQSAKINEDVYNHIVTLLTMCINKELQILLEEKDDDISVEMYPKRVMEIYDEVLKVYKNENLKAINNERIPIIEKDTFLNYLNYMVECLLSGIKYIEKTDDKWTLSDKKNEWNTRYRREERVRDCMKRLIAKDTDFAKFTINHCIETPYMYVLAWDLPNLFVYFNDRKSKEENNSYVEYLRRNTSIELRFISENLLDILLHGKQRDEEKWEKDSPNSPIEFHPEVNYVGLLPTISFVENVDYNNDLEEKQKVRPKVIPYVKKEVLKRRPLLPMESNMGRYKPEKATEFMVSFMTEENKTKDYQESDIKKFIDCMSELNGKLQSWILQDKVKLYGIKDEVTAVAYLRSIFDQVNSDPRRNTVSSKNSYINSIVNIIAKQWDRINKEEVENNKSYIRYAYFSVLKLSRNWESHSEIRSFQKKSIQFCVFLYLISIRYMIEVDSLNSEDFREYLFLESKLFKFLGKQGKKYEDISLEELEAEYQRLYKNVDRKAFKNDDRKWARKREYPKSEIEQKPHQVLNVAGYDCSKIKSGMSENEIFLTFWLSIHMGKNNTLKKIDKSDINIIEILERTYEYQKRSELLK